MDQADRTLETVGPSGPHTGPSGPQLNNPLKNKAQIPMHHRWVTSERPYPVVLLAKSRFCMVMRGVCLLREAFCRIRRLVVH